MGPSLKFSGSLCMLGTMPVGSCAFRFIVSGSLAGCYLTQGMGGPTWFQQRGEAPSEIYSEYKKWSAIASPKRKQLTMTHCTRNEPT